MVVDLRDRRFPQPTPYAPWVQPQPQPQVQPTNRTTTPKSDKIDLLNPQRSAPQPRQPEESDSGWGRGLGIVINNPITRNIMTPLRVLDVPRRGYLAGMEGIADALPDWGEAALGAATLGLTAPAMLIDEERARENTEERDLSLWDKLWHDQGYGWGEVTPDTGNTWLDRGIGLAGDLAFDPLTYVGGIGAAGKVGTVGGRSGRALGVARAVDKGADVSEASQILRRGFGYASDDFLEKAGVSGGVRLNAPFARGAGWTVPGTTAPVRQLSKARGALGDRFLGTSAGRGALSLRTPRGMEKSYGTLYRGTNELSMREALEHVAMRAPQRHAKQTFQGVADRSTRAVRRELSKLSDEEKRAAIRLAETGGDGNRGKLGKAFDWLWTKADEAGLPLNRRVNYTTHLTTREGKRWMSSGDAAATNYKQVMSPATISELDESGVTMQRAFTKGHKFKVGNDTFEITDDTIEGLNAKMREAFGIDFDMFETDPGVILERYINMLSDDVGWHHALGQRAKQGVNARRLTPDQSRALGLEDDTPRQTFFAEGSGKVQEGDLEAIGDTANVRFDPETMEAQLDARGTKAANKARAKFADEQAKAARDRGREAHKQINSLFKQGQKLWRDATKDIFRRQRAIHKTASEAIGQLEKSIVDQRRYLATMSDRAAYIDESMDLAQRWTDQLNEVLNDPAQMNDALQAELGALRGRAETLVKQLKRDKAILEGSEQQFADEVMQYATQGERTARQEADLWRATTAEDKASLAAEAEARVGVPEAQAAADERLARLEGAVEQDPLARMWHEEEPPGPRPPRQTENAAMGLPPGSRREARIAKQELNDASNQLRIDKRALDRYQGNPNSEIGRSLTDKVDKSRKKAADAERKLDKILNPGRHVQRRIDQSFLDAEQEAASRLVAAEQERAAAAATATPKDIKEFDRAVNNAQKALDRARRATERERERLRKLRKEVKEEVAAEEADAAETAASRAEREAQPSKGAQERAKLTKKVAEDEAEVERLQGGVRQIKEEEARLQDMEDNLVDARKDVRRKLPTPKLADDDTVYVDLVQSRRGVSETLRYHVVEKKMPNGERRWNVIDPTDRRLTANHKSMPEAVDSIRDEVRQMRRSRISNLEDGIKTRKKNLSNLRREHRGAEGQVATLRGRLGRNRVRLTRLQNEATRVADEVVETTDELVSGVKRQSIRWLEGEARAAHDEVLRLRSRAAKDPERVAAEKRLDEIVSEAERRIGLGEQADINRPSPFDPNEFRDPETGAFNFAVGDPGYLPEIQPGGWRQTPNLGLESSRRPLLEALYQDGRNQIPPSQAIGGDESALSAYMIGREHARQGVPDQGLPDEMFVSPTNDPGARAIAQNVRESIPKRQAQAAERIPPTMERLEAIRRLAEAAEFSDPAERFVLTRRGQRGLLEEQRPAREMAQELRGVGTKPSQAVKSGEEWVGPRSPWDTPNTQQQFYRDEVTRTQEQIGENLNDLAGAVSTRGGADQALRAASDNVQKFATEVDLPMRGSPTVARGNDVRTGRNYGGGRPRPKHLNTDQYAYEQTQLANSMKAVIEDSNIPDETKAAAAEVFNQGLDMLDEVKKADLTDARWREIRKGAKKGDSVRAMNVGLQDGWEVVMPTVAPDIIVSRGLRQAMQSTWQATNDPQFWPLLDGFTNLFKTYATMTPGFHVRNAMSSIFLNSSDNVSVSTQIEGLNLTRRLGRAARRGEMDAFWKSLDKDSRLAIEGAFGTGIAGQFGERGVGDRASVRGALTERAFQNWATNLSKRGGELVEGAARVPVVLDSIRRGRKHGMSAYDSMLEGMERASYLHFDYSQVSKLDERMKRLIPFWTFMSRNLPLQVTQMWTKPRAYAHYNSLIRNVRGDAEPNTPEYFEETGYYRIGDLNLGGLPLYGGLDLPHTRVEEDVQAYTSVLDGDNPLRVFSNFNPLFTAPAEYVTEKNFFTGRQYDETDVRQLGGLEKALMPLAKVTGNEEDGVVNEKFIDALRSVVPIYDRSVRLAPGVTTGARSEDAESRQLESYLRFLGVPVRQLSPQQQRSTQRGEYFDQQDQRNRQRAVAQALAGG